MGLGPLPGQPSRVGSEASWVVKNKSAAQVAEAVTALVKPIVDDLGVEVDRVEYRDSGRRAVLQVFIDRPPGGPTLHDCVDVSRQLSALLDVHDVVPKAFTLEVSSPGLDRPLNGEADYRRFAGRAASLTCRRAVGEAGLGSKVLGILRGVEGSDVLMEQPDGHTVRVPMAQVAKARLEVVVEGSGAHGPSRG